MRPAVLVPRRCSPASIALASLAILLGYISLARRFPLEAWRRLRKMGSLFQGNRIGGALPASSHPVAKTLAAFNSNAKRFFHDIFRPNARTLRFCEHQHPVVCTEIATCFGKNKTIGLEHLPDLGLLGRANFHSYVAARFKMLCRTGSNGPIGFQPVHATVQSPARIEITYFRLQRTDIA